MRTLAFAALSAVLFGSFIAGCRDRAPEPRAAMTDAQAGIVHVVIVWLKQPGNAAHRQRVIDSAEELKAIPGLLEVGAGPPLPSTRPVVDGGYDVAIVMKFRDEASLRAWGPHPEHQRIVREVVEPLVERYLVYDFVPAR